VAYAVRAGAVYALAQRTWAVRYDWPPVARLLGITIVTGSLGMVAARAPLLASIGLHVGLLATYAGAVWGLGVLSPADRLALRTSVRSPASAVAVILGRS
jgi:hypothetical protein